MAENKFNFHINLSGNFDRDVNFTNSLKNITNSWAIINGYRLVSNLDKLDLTVSVYGSVNRAKPIQFHQIQIRGFTHLAQILV